MQEILAQSSDQKEHSKLKSEKKCLIWETWGVLWCIEVCNKIAPPLAHVPCLAPYLCQRDAILLPLLNSSSIFFSPPFLALISDANSDRRKIEQLSTDVSEIYF